MDITEEVAAAVEGRGQEVVAVVAKEWVNLELQPQLWMAAAAAPLAVEYRVKEK